MPKIIAVAGPRGAGKTTLTAALATRLEGARRASFGAFVRDEASRLGLSHDRATLEALGSSLLAQFGPAEFTRRVLALAVVDVSRLQIVDGVRHIAVWTAIRELSPDALLLYIDVPESIRVARVASQAGNSLARARREILSPMELDALQLRPQAEIVLTPSATTNWVSTVCDRLVERGWLTL